MCVFLFARREVLTRLLVTTPSIFLIRHLGAALLELLLDLGKQVCTLKVKVHKDGVLFEQQLESDA